MPPSRRRTLPAWLRPGGVFLAATLSAVMLCPATAQENDGAPILEGNVVRRASQIVPEPNGKLVAVGEPPADGSALTLIRFKANGRVDRGFNTSGLGLLTVDFITRLADGKFLLAGTFADPAGNPSQRLVKLNPDGSLDPDFKPGRAYAASAAVQGDGRILLLEMASSSAGGIQPTLIRLHPDGRRDDSFRSEVRLLAGSAYRLRVQPDGGVLVIGKDGAGTGQLSLQRLQSDGSPDRTFHAAGPVAMGYGVSALAQTPDGKLLVAEFADPARSVCTLNRLMTNGELDPDYVVPAPLGAPVYQLAADRSGRVVFAGAFTQVNGTPRPGFARLESDGRLDNSFDPLSDPSPSFDGFVAAKTGTVTFARALTAAESVGLSDGPGVLLEQYGADGSAVSAVKILACPACELVPGNQELVYVRVKDPAPLEPSATTLPAP